MASSGALKHIGNYASAGTLGALAGLITFPLLTRNLSVAEYGILVLITSSLTLFVAVGKFGTQHAVIRFYSQIKNGNIQHSMLQMNSTVAAMFMFFATAATLLWVAAGYLVLPSISEVENIANLFLIASGVVFLRLLGSSVINFLRAQERSAAVGVSIIIAKYLYLIAVVLVAIISELSVAFVLLSMLIAEVVSVHYVAKKYWPDFSFEKTSISKKLGKAMLVYGVPLMMLESLGLILRLSDRFLIQGMLGEMELGMYSASYNFTAYLDIVLLTAMVQAIKPHYMELWEGSGEIRTKDFLTHGFRTYLVIGIPLIALFSLVAPHLLNILASPKYAPGTIIIPFVALSFLLDGSMHFLAAGLYIKKNTKVFMFWGSVTVGINLILNILLIPLYGIMGAAVVTIVSYAIFMLTVSLKAFQFVSFDIDYRIPLYLSLLSLMVYAVLSQIDFTGDIVDLLLKGCVGTVLLVAGSLAIDERSRHWLTERLRSLTPGAAK